jgi:hypothetical protein
VLTIFDEEDQIFKAIKAGAFGYAFLILILVDLSTFLESTYFRTIQSNPFRNGSRTCGTLG